MPAPSRRVEDDESRPTDALCHEFGGHGLLDHAQRAEPGAVVPCVGTGESVALDGQDGPVGPDGLGQWHREETGARVQVGDRLPGERSRHGQDGIEEGSGCPDVHLPEDAGRDAIGAAVHDGAHRTGRVAHDSPHDESGAGWEIRHRHVRAAPRPDADDGVVRADPGHHLDLGRSPPAHRQRAGVGHGGRRDGAVVDHLDPMGAMAAKPRAALPVHGEANPAAPGQTLTVSGDGFDVHGTGDPGEAGKLLRHVPGLEPTLCRGRHVLIVAPPAAPRPGVGAGRLDPVGRRLQDLDGVGPQEGGRRRGHTGPDALARQGVAHEDHPAVRRVAHAAPARCDGTHVEFEHPLDEPSGHEPERKPVEVGQNSPRGVDRAASRSSYRAHEPTKEEPMRYLLMIATEERAAESTPEAESVSPEYAAFAKEMAERGVLLGGERLRLTSDATTVRVRNGEVLATDGPFAETKEQLAGYFVVDCKDLDEAIDVAAKIPGARDGSVEVRPIWEM